MSFSFSLANLPFYFEEIYQHHSKQNNWIAFGERNLETQNGLGANANIKTLTLPIS